MVQDGGWKFWKCRWQKEVDGAKAISFSVTYYDGGAIFHYADIFGGEKDMGSSITKYAE